MMPSGDSIVFRRKAGARAQQSGDLAMAKGFLWGILLGVVVHLGTVPAYASGSVGPGMGPLSARGAYTLGKGLLYRELVCRKCPIPRRGFNRERARELKATLDAALSDDRQDSPEDERIRALFTDNPEETVANVAAVRAYLARRYKL